MRIDYRRGIDDESIRKNAAELVALAPDVIVANAPPTVLALQRLTGTPPIVFTSVPDPLILGFVQSLAKPAATSRALPLSSWT